MDRDKIDGVGKFERDVFGDKVVFNETDKLPLRIHIELEEVYGNRMAKVHFFLQNFIQILKRGGLHVYDLIDG
jgi:hypothetical protein